MLNTLRRLVCISDNFPRNIDNLPTFTAFSFPALAKESVFGCMSMSNMVEEESFTTCRISLTNTNIVI